jgi:histidine ammonia-lyase
MLELDGRSLAPPTVAELADGVPVRCAATARARNAAALRVVEDHVARRAPFYGVTTGVGVLRDRAVVDHAEHQRALLRSHAAGTGEPLTPRVVRAALGVRLNQLAAGGGGVSDALLDAVAAALDADVVPVAYERGSLGTGDLTALAEIALALLGEGEAFHAGERVPAADALASAGLRPPELGPRDGAAFISSNAPTIARAALVAVDARRMHEAALAVAALSFEAARADPGVLDARVHAARPLAGQVAVAERMRELLAGVARPPDRGVHGPFGFRCQPQVDGVARESLEALERVLAVELNAAAENPVVIADDGVALPSGNFHIGALSLALDGLRAALAQAAWLVADRVSALLDERLSGLRDGLAAGPGASSGALIVEYTAHGAAGDISTLAAPAVTYHASIAAGIESHASFAPTAARLAHVALDHYADALAAELVVAVRALRLAERAPAGAGAQALWSRAVAVLSPEMGDRPLAVDLRQARSLVLEVP